MTPTWLTLRQASERINVSIDILTRAIHATDPRTHLPARRNGNKFVIRTEDVDAWPERGLPVA